MQKRTLFGRILCAAACLSLAAAAQLGAVDFPTREIRIIVPYRAGGQSDLAARKIAEIVQKQNILPQTVLVVNMSGANTLEGLRATRDAKPDGYTLLLHHTSMLTMDALGTLNLDWRNAFDPVCQIMEVPYVFSVKAKRDDGKTWKSLSDFAADAKANPGKYTVSIQGVGGSAHFAGAQVLMALGIDKDVKYMPLTGGSDSATALMAGRVDIRPAPSSDVARFVRSGDETVLAFISDKPSESFPGAELSGDLKLNYPIVLRSGLWTAKDTPKEVVKILEDAMRKIVDSAEFKDFMKSQTANPAFMTGAEWLPVFEKDAETINALGKTITAN